MSHPSRPRVRLLRQADDEPDRLDNRARIRVLKWMGGQGAGKPRSAGEIYTFASISTLLPFGGMPSLLSYLVGRGDLVVVDGCKPANPGDKRPHYRGYILPPSPIGERGGAA